ncbi:MAG TPA: HAD-IA family hydrolase [Polyangiales bacterium]|nr:HAD-IA family hydrolase [Polyangiales bacterium]
MPPRVILWDIMDTLVRDPFFTHMPGFFGQSFEGLVQKLQPGTWVEFELGKLNELEFFARFFRDRSPIDGPGLKRCMAQAYDWVDGMPELLKELRSRQVSMHALSNYPEWYQLVEERLALSDFVALTFISCHTGFRKPAPEAFLNACEQLEVAPEHCLLVDDRIQNCEAARRVGLQSLHFDGSISQLRQGLVEHRLL